MTEPDLDAFPPESDWLDLVPPTIGDDFVGRTMAVLKDAGVVGAGDTERIAGDEPLPADLLAALQPPTSGGAFVDRTLAAVQQGRAEQWRRLLLRYESPAPTPDFVARTLAALRQAQPARGPARPFARRSWPTLLLAAAATVLVLLAIRPERSASALQQLVASTPATLAVAQSPAVLSHLLHGTVDPDALPLQAPDADWLWLTAEAPR